MDNRTTIFNVKDLRQELILMTLYEVIEDLEEAGYNATNQITGYILSGDLDYITNKNNARKKMSKFNRSEVLLAIINGYLGK